MEGNCAKQAITDDYAWYLGDCVDLIDVVPDDSVGMAVFSPPFPGMYAYTDSPRDMGNCRGIEEMIDQFRFLIAKDKLYRAMMPSRSCCVHLTQTPIFKFQEGYAGLRDFRGDVIRLFESEGWIYYGEATIDKDPQVKAVRTKDASLQFKSLREDSNRLRPAMADYLLIFKTHGENPSPIKAGSAMPDGNPNGWVTNDEWIEWAAPAWRRYSNLSPNGIKETDVLQFRAAKDADDEKHLCPLQLGVIERCIKLWSAPGEVVLSPFGGIGSEGYQALRYGRKFIGFELKPSYWKVGLQNLDAGIAKRAEESADLFSMISEGD